MSESSWLIMGRTRTIREDLEEMLVKKNVFFRVKMRDNKYRYSIKSQERNAILSWKDLTIYKNSISLKMVENMYKVLGKDFVTRGFKKIVSEQRKALPDKKVSFDELKQDYGLVAEISQSWVDVMTTLNTETRAYLENLESRGEDIGREPRITLSTIHQQKGGEADNVIVSLDIGKMAYDDYKKNPISEHRLFYVAFSRAKENLYIMTPTSKEAYRV
jgi:DNA helicase-2/ATP-dependent DNA helicase PcrA